MTGSAETTNHSTRQRDKHRTPRRTQCEVYAYDVCVLTKEGNGGRSCYGCPLNLTFCSSNRGSSVFWGLPIGMSKRGFLGATGETYGLSSSSRLRVPPSWSVSCALKYSHVTGSLE